jgi:hypothetical protein
LSEKNEIILAQEQDVVAKDDIPKSVKKIVGTLVLTEQRLLLVEANKEEDYDMGEGVLSKRSATFRYADVDDLGEISSNPNNFSITLNSITSATGSEGILHPPELKVKWTVNGREEHAVFTEELIGGRKRDLKDWARVIQGLKAGTITIRRPSGQPPSMDSLEGRILHVLGDMQEKGVFEIEQDTESAFNIDLDPDQVEASAEKLASSGFLDKTVDKSGDSFYRKRSPLGEDDLSS